MGACILENSVSRKNLEGYSGQVSVDEFSMEMLWQKMCSPSPLFPQCCDPWMYKQWSREVTFTFAYTLSETSTATLHLVIVLHFFKKTVVKTENGEENSVK